MTHRFLALIAAAGISFAILPAQAAWHGYVNKEVGFSFIAPGDVKAEKATYKSEAAGERPATVFQSTEDNVVYKVTVVDFGNTAEADAIKEATANLQDEGNKILADEQARVDQSYGRGSRSIFPTMADGRWPVSISRVVISFSLRRSCCPRTAITRRRIWDGLSNRSLFLKAASRRMQRN
jgi:hypothetical protein